MNRATDEDVRAALEAFYKSQASQPKIEADFAEDVVEDFTEPMRAAADTLLSRRMPTREAIRDALTRSDDVWLTDDEDLRDERERVIDAIADLFGVTD